MIGFATRRKDKKNLGEPRLLPFGRAGRALRVSLVKNEAAAAIPLAASAHTGALRNNPILFNAPSNCKVQFRKRVLGVALLIFISIFFNACNPLPLREGIPLACSIQVEADMDLLLFEQHLDSLKAEGFTYFQLDLPLLRNTHGLPLPDTSLASLLPLLTDKIVTRFPHWTLCLKRLHPDSVANAEAMAHHQAAEWCAFYIRAAEFYMEGLQQTPYRFVAGVHLPLADSLPCLQTWLLSLHPKFQQVTWLIPPDKLPHAIHTVCTEKGVYLALASGKPSKPYMRNIVQDIQKDSNTQGVFIGAFYPRHGTAHDDFINLLRFWKTEYQVSGITFASIFPVPVFQNPDAPGSLYYETELKEEIHRYLNTP